MSEIVNKINQLKKERDAIILVHNYQPAEVQDIADFLGDSLDLSLKAARTEKRVIVFCGVHFMAETAAILSPDKAVLIPEPEAGCPMADMITAEQLRTLKKEHPLAATVCYVNTTAEVKAESDICCTSSNAVQIVASLPQRDIIFVPDINLGRYVESQTGKKMVLWPGYCIVHSRFSVEDVQKARKAHPEAELIVHPECPQQIIRLADGVYSTTGMCVRVKESRAKEFIIGTETGILHRMRKENPDKKFYPLAECAVCANMKKNSLEKVLWALEDMKNIVKVAPAISAKAKKAIDRMLEFSKKNDNIK
jgi:quinolinate synthase